MSRIRTGVADLGAGRHAMAQDIVRLSASCGGAATVELVAYQRTVTPVAHAGTPNHTAIRRLCNTALVRCTQPSGAPIPRRTGASDCTRSVAQEGRETGMRHRSLRIVLALGLLMALFVPSVNVPGLGQMWPGLRAGQIEAGARGSEPALPTGLLRAMTRAGLQPAAPPGRSSKS
jgi:hypothetical protein